MWRAIKKVVFKAIIELNRLIFLDEDETLKKLNIDNWVINKEKLIRLKNTTLIDEAILYILSTYKLF